MGFRKELHNLVENSIYYTRVFVYCILIFFSYRCACYVGNVGVKYIMNCIVVAWAIAEFFVKPRFETGRFCVRFAIIMYMPFLVVWLWSILLWIKELQTLDYVIRGSLNTVYMLTSVLFVAASFYLFKRKCVFYNMAMLTVANGMIAMKTVAARGIGEVVSSYITLIISFANKTPPAMQELELHEVAFAWGAFSIFFLCIKEDKIWKNIVGGILSLFFFSITFKRIAIVGVVLAIPIYHIFTRVKHLKIRKIMFIVSMATVAFEFLYVISVKTGFFNEIMAEMGVNLMGRDAALIPFNSLYEISPTYMGRGVRFVYQYIKTSEDVTAMIHNVFLETYIEVGFFMWFVWAILVVYGRERLLAGKYSDKSVVLLFAMTVYAVITYMTDNTYMYFSITVAYNMGAMVSCYDEAVKANLLESEEIRFLEE